MSEFLDLTRFKTCKCGANVEDQWVKVDSKYSAVGWFWWSMGATALPKSISFTCTKCNNKFEEITDKNLIKYYIFYRKN